MGNAAVASVLSEIADLLELQQADTFRVRAYRNAARAVQEWPEPLEAMAAEGRDADELPGVGKSTAEKIREILHTGTCRRLQELRSQVPTELTQLMRIPGLGPRRAWQFYQDLGVRTLDDLRRACREHRVATLEGMGEKTERHILEGLDLLERAAGRFLYHDAEDHVRMLGDHLNTLEAVRRWEAAGSFRRRTETVGDLDILVEALDRQAATEQILAHGLVGEVIRRGPERLSVRLTTGMQVDFRFVEAESFGSALLYFTGSKAHNIALRRRAIDRRWKLNEYGLFKDDTLLAGKDEVSIYRRLGMAWIAPELREDRGELEAAEAGKLPRLIELKDVRGDLQSHTTASDGNDDIETMARAARQLGHAYLAITDHSKSLRVAHGLDEARLREHAANIRRIGGRLKGFWLMAGVEVDILRDGRLDIDQDVLAELDWVVASVHSAMNMDEDEMTERILRAIRSGRVHALGHPLGRLIGRRDPIRFRAEAVFQACREHRVALEINAQPDRLDLPDHLCIQARQAGVQFTLGTDAHRHADLGHIAYAVNVARRAWLEPADVLNTLTAAQLRKRLKPSKPRRK